MFFSFFLCVFFVFYVFFFFFNDTATTEIYTLSLHDALPIYAFAIEHPEGVIVVDTGEDARASQRSYFARWHPGLRAFREWVEPEQEIGPQLERLGIRPGDVRWVVMTHLHTDHAGGLHHFPDNEILVTRTELEFASGR